MATTSEVEVALDAIAARIVEQRQTGLKSKSNAGVAVGALDAITVDFADVITTIQAMGTTNAYEAAVKAKFAKLQAEFGALKTGLTTIRDTAIG